MSTPRELPVIELTVLGGAITRNDTKYAVAFLQFHTPTGIYRFPFEIHQFENLRDHITACLEALERDEPESMANARAFREEADEHTFLIPIEQKMYDTLTDRCQCEGCQERRRRARENAQA